MDKFSTSSGKDISLVLRVVKVGNNIDSEHSRNLLGTQISDAEDYKEMQGPDD